MEKQPKNKTGRARTHLAPGTKINSWTVLNPVIKGHSTYFEVYCVCGNRSTHRYDKLRLHYSCGCLTRPTSELKNELDEDQIKVIKSFLKTGVYSVPEIAHMFNITQRKANGILKTIRKR